MTDSTDITHGPAFYGQLFSKALGTILLVMGVGVLDIWIIGLIESSFITVAITLMAALIKTFFIVRLTFNQLGKIIGQSHLLSHVLVLFALLIGLIVLSFATDYTALFLVDSCNFELTLSHGNSKPVLFFEFLYFSLITFSSVGFGDIVPIAFSSKLLVMLKVVLSFFVLVFGIANINRIHVNNK